MPKDMSSRQASEIAIGRRKSVFSLLRESWWMTTEYIACKTKLDMTTTKRDLMKLKACRHVEIVQALDTTDKGEVTRRSIVRLTDLGRKYKLHALGIGETKCQD